MRLEPRGRRAAHPAPLLGVHGSDAASEELARPFLDLDEDEPSAAARDQVELVAAAAHVRGDDAVAAEPVVARGDPLPAVHAATVSRYARAWNERRCCGHGPCAWTARVCSGVM